MSDKIDIHEIERHIQRWLREALAAGQTVCELHAKPPIPPALPQVAPGHRRTAAEVAAAVANLEKFKLKVAEAKDLVAAKTAMYLVLLNKAARWAIRWKELAPQYSEIADAYLSKYSPSKDLRDILEHDDEYLTGKGRFRDRVVQSAMGGAAQVDAFSTLIIDGEIFIGGTLSVQGLMQAAAEFDTALVALRKAAVSS